MARLAASRKFQNWGTRDRVLRESHKVRDALHIPSGADLETIWGREGNIVIFRYTNALPPAKSSSGVEALAHSIS
jgi:hypothetical protein